MSDMFKRIAEYYNRDRQTQLDQRNPIQNPFDIPGEFLDDLKRRKIQQFFTTTIDLSVAGNLVIKSPGFHVAIFGFATDQAAIRAVNTTAIVFCQFEEEEYNPNVNGFPMKHARGFSGPFTQLALQWPAQNNVSCDVVVYKGAQTPWIDGESAT